MTDHFDDIPNPTREHIAQSLTADAIREAELLSYRLFYSVEKIEALTKIPADRATLDQYDTIEQNASHIKDRLNEAPLFRNNAYLVAILEKAAEWQKIARYNWIEDVRLYRNGLGPNGPAEALKTVRRARPVDTPAMAAARAAIREFLDRDRYTEVTLMASVNGDFEELTMLPNQLGTRYIFREEGPESNLRGPIEREDYYQDFDKVLARLEYPQRLAQGIPTDRRLWPAEVGK